MSGVASRKKKDGRRGTAGGRRRRFRVFWLVALLLPAPAFLLWKRAAKDARPRNLIIVSIDTLRADHVSAYGESFSRTPNIDRLASSGVSFLEAQTTSPLTLPAHASLLTGRNPPRHGVRDNVGFRLSDRPDTLASSLRAAGYDTGAFVGSYVLDSSFGLARGFDEYFDEFETEADSPAPPERPGDEVLERAITWLSGRGSTPFFAWVHFYDPHTPYAPPPPFEPEVRTDRDLYSGEVAFVDSLVGRLVGWLDENELDASTIVVLTSDHGESLGEHDERTHGFFLYQSTLRIPLIVSFPGAERGARVATPVRIIDIAPTVLDLLELPIQAGVDGRSLVPLLGRPDAGLGREPPGYAETFYPRLGFGWSELKSLREGKYKMILAPRAELYDLSRDPGESRNLIASLPLVADDLRERLEELDSGSPASAPESLGEDAAAALRSLGYVSAGSTDLSSPARPLADPKDRIALYHLVNDPSLHTVSPADGPAYEEAVATLERVLAEDPGITYARILLGQLFLRANRTEEAVQAFEAVVQKAPDNVPAIYDLAAARIALGELDAAETALRRALELDGRNIKIYLELSELERRRGRYEAAESWIVKALEVEPSRWLRGVRAEVLIEAGAFGEAETLLSALAGENETDAKTLYNLGQVLLMQGRSSEALRQLERAQALDPADADVPLALGNALAAEDRHEEAAAWYRRALRSAPCSALAHANLGTAQHRLGRIDDAIGSYRRAIECDPAYAGALVNLAAALQEKNDLDGALEALEAAVALSPDDGALADALRELRSNVAKQE